MLRRIRASWAATVRRQLEITLVAALVLLASVALGQGFPDPGGVVGAYRPQEILVRFRAEALAGVDAKRSSPEDLAEGILLRPGIAALNRSVGVERIEPVFRWRATLSSPTRGHAVETEWRRAFFRIELHPGVDPLEAVAAYASHPDVEAAQPNYVYAPDVVPDDTHYSGQYAHSLTEAELGWDIETGDPGIVIAVLGTGVELIHPDLAAKIWVNSDEIDGNLIDDDLNGFIDDRYGWDFSGNDNDPSPTTSSHETRVAGVAAADTDNGWGVAGVAWLCPIMPVRADYTSTGMAQAIDYAADNGARVINMSFGNYDIDKYGPDTIVEAAIDAAFGDGAVLVATAGNDEIDSKRYPAALAPVIAVAATDRFDERADFSNYGAWITVAAPGKAITTTTTGGGIDIGDGTSYAAPYVSGLAALLLSKDPALSPESVRRRIQYSVDRIDTDHFIGSGRVNVQNALSLNADPDLYALIASPEAGRTLREITSVTGTALGDGYVLELREHGEGAWEIVASGAEVIEGPLGLLDPTERARGWHELRLSVSRGAQSDTHQIEIELTVGEQVMAGWPQYPPGYSTSEPTYADVDGDGDFELFVATPLLVMGWHHDGTPVSGWPQAAQTQGCPAVSIGDIDGDGDPEIVAAGENHAKVYAWQHTGSPIPGWPLDAGSNDPRIGGAAVLADLDDIPGMEVIVSVRELVGGTSVTWIHAWRSDGTSLPGFPAAVALETVWTSPAVGDLDGDGDKELIVGTNDGLHALHHNGIPVTGWPFAYDGSSAAPLAVDIDGDGVDEVVGLGNFEVFVLDGDATVLSSTPTAGTTMRTDAALGDLNGNGRPEICVGSIEGHVNLVALEGGQLPGWPLQVDERIEGCSIADVDGDGEQEVLVNPLDEFVQAWNADGSRTARVFPLAFPARAWHAPALGDLDGDGRIDLMIGVQHDGVYAYELGAKLHLASTPWPMHRGSERNQGRYTGSPICGDLDENGQLADSDASFFRTYLANPLSPELPASLPQRCSVVLPEGPCTILDLVITGRALESLAPGIAQVCPAVSY